MRLCLAGTFPAEKIVKEYRPEYVLESFFYIRPWQIEEIPKWKMFLQKERKLLKTRNLTEEEDLSEQYAVRYVPCLYG